MLTAHPADFSVLLVGMDERGDLEIGKVLRMEIGGRQVDFLPVVHIPDDTIHSAAKKLFQSVTLRYALGCLKHFGTIRRLSKGVRASTEIQRFEFAPLARALGNPIVQLVHGQAIKDAAMDSLIKRYWLVHVANEQLALRLADRVVAVNPNIVERYRAEMPKIAEKTEMMTVSVDMDRFPAAPFPVDDTFRIVFAGRLDAFKDPPLMFEVMRRLHDRLEGRFAFHYVGTSDPHRYPQFQAIEGFTVRHGFQTGEGVSRILRDCHAGVLTSFFEGMPCYLLELLSSGRPCGAIRLPQYDPLIVDGVSGFQFDRSENREADADRLAASFASLWADIRAGRLDPAAIREKVLPYSVMVQMPRLFERHRALAAGTALPPAGVVASAG